MTKMSDVAVPSLLITEGTEPSAPAAGKQRLYIDSTTHTLHRTDSSGTEVDIESAGAGSVATDDIWDAAGDLAVGSGANTAARLAIGAAGGTLSRVNGAVAWNSGTSFPTAATGDRYWRTDLGLECYYDGTRWLTASEYSLSFVLIQSLLPISANATAFMLAASPTGKANDIWMTTWTSVARIAATNSGTLYWTFDLSKYTGNFSGTSITTFNTSADTAGNLTVHNTAINALLGTGHEVLGISATKTSTPGNVNHFVSTLRYRIVIT